MSQKKFTKHSSNIDYDVVKHAKPMKIIERHSLENYMIEDDVDLECENDVDEYESYEERIAYQEYLLRSSSKAKDWNITETGHVFVI